MTLTRTSSGPLRGPTDRRGEVAPVPSPMNSGRSEERSGEGHEPTLSAGTKLGPYEILAPIGAGGMGEVYRAKDPRLGREVAIKVLPASLSQDADRLRRFERRRDPPRR